jgi:hypothetical protein
VEPRTVREETDGVRSGGSGTVAATAYGIAGAVRGGVTLTVRVPPGFWQQLDSGGASATLLIDPDEARGFAGWLDEAAEAAERTGPALYGR